MYIRTKKKYNFPLMYKSSIHRKGFFLQDQHMQISCFVY